MNALNFATMVIDTQASLLREVERAERAERDAYYAWCHATSLADWDQKQAAHRDAKHRLESAQRNLREAGEER